MSALGLVVVAFTLAGALRKGVGRAVELSWPAGTRSYVDWAYIVRW
jgi:hypothetical protein